MRISTLMDKTGKGQKFKGRTALCSPNSPERLKDLRVEHGLTLEQLSAETGISKSALGKYEADDFKDISPFSMVELAKFYGVSTDYLLGLTDRRDPL